MRRIALLLLPVLMVSACHQGHVSLTKPEIQLINAEGDVMRVLTVDCQEDSLFLRTPSSDFRVGDIGSDVYHRLAEKMIATVTSPEQDGVGIAGPQVGLLRRVVAVQRFDKDGQPFEVYPNIRITRKGGSLELGREGCLSVPGKRGEVMRYHEIEISYVSPQTLKDTSETVRDFTAVIFQHECDHLDGVLYIDKIEN